MSPTECALEGWTRFHGGRGSLAAVLSLCVGLGSACTEDSKNVSALAPAHESFANNEDHAPALPSEPTCLVAMIGATRLTVADVAALRAVIEPPPTWPASTRLAVDVWLASESAPLAALEAPRVRARLSAYRHLHKLSRTQRRDAHEALAYVRTALDTRATAMGLEIGPCYVARSADQ